MSVKLYNYCKELPDETVRSVLELVRKAVGCRRGVVVRFKKFGQYKAGYAYRSTWVRVRLPGSRKVIVVRTSYGYFDLYPGFFWREAKVQITEKSARKLTMDWIATAAHEFQHVKDYQDEGKGLAKYKWAHDQARVQGKSRRDRWINRPEEARANYGEKQAMIRLLSEPAFADKLDPLIDKIVEVLRSYGKAPTQDPDHAVTDLVSVP